MMIGLALAAAAAAAPSPCAVTLTDAKVWNGRGFDTRTLNVGTGGPAVSGAMLWIIPPFADAHTHTIDEATLPGAPAAHERMLRLGVLYAVNPNNIRTPGPTPIAPPTQVQLEAAGGGVTGPGGHPRPLYTFLAGRGWAGPGITVADLPGRAFQDPRRDWSALGQPVVAMRDRRLILDDAGLLAAACGAPALKSRFGA